MYLTVRTNTPYISLRQRTLQQQDRKRPMDQKVVHLRQADEIGLVGGMAIFCDRMLMVFMSTNLKAILLNIKQNLDQRVLCYKKIISVLY
jgi:hypothetical protein